MKKEIILGIYMIASPSGKIYIGQSEDIHKRWNWYKLGHCKSQIKLNRSFNKHGIENHKFEIICECEETQLDYLEMYLIRFYDTFETPYGLNLTQGGEGGKLSQESLKKLSNSLKARKAIYGPRVLSEETKERIRKGMMGKPGTMNDKKHTVESKNKISQSLMGNTYCLGYKQPATMIASRIATRKSNNKESPLKGREVPLGQIEKIGKASKLMWEKRKNDPEWNSEENKKRRSESARIAATKQRDENPEQYYSEASKKKRSDQRKLAAKKRRESPEYANRDKTIKTELGKRVWEIRKSNPDYNSPENRKKRRDASLKTAKATWDRIRQEKLTMIF